MTPPTLFFSSIILALIYFIKCENPIVELPTGTIRGRQAVTLRGTNYYVFEKIPFAEPPVGELRFKPPVPVGKWEGILNTTSYDRICPQSSLDDPAESEDCLYLNVYTPVLNSTDQLAVLFAIYGGGFVDGDCRRCGPDFFIDDGIILVTTNYRVGPFGFLSTEDLILPGNNGLKDQHLAIKWTNDNIALFGGNPKQITIAGQSAGSASATYQLLNPNSEGLFRGVIGESGSFLSPWAFQRRARSAAFELAALIDDSFANSDDSEALHEFLMALPEEVIDQAAQQYALKDNIEHTQIVQGFFWAPVVEVEHEEAFITRRMYEQFLEGDIVKVSTFLGFNSEEDLFFAADINALQYRLNLLDENPDWATSEDMRIETLDDRIEMGLKIRDIYTSGQPFVANLSTGLRYLSDQSFIRSVIKHADIQSNFTEVYLYKFSYHGVMGTDNIYLEGAERVVHGEDTLYLFHIGNNDDDSAFPESDVLVRNRFVRAFTNFVKYLNPTPDSSDELMQGITWPLVNASGPGQLMYVDIDENLQVKSNPRWDTYQGWNELYDSLPYNDFDTY